MEFRDHSGDQSMNKKIFSKIISMVTVCAIILAMAEPVAAFAETSGSDDFLETIGEQLGASLDDDPFAFRTTRRPMFRSTGLTPVYDLRDVGGKNYVTPVKLQNPYATCWGFAAIGAAETSILSTMYKDTGDNGLDLSEKHLCYFTNRLISDSKEVHSQTGEGTVIVNPEASSDYYVEGNPEYATVLFASGRGPALESDNALFEYRGKEGHNNGYYYLPTDDWSINDNLMFTSDYSLKASHILPNPSRYLVNSDMTNFGAAITEMKKEIKAGRAIQISYKSPNALPGQSVRKDYINTDTWAHYTYNADVAPDHGVLIVGWDDHYPKENFVHELDSGQMSPAPNNDGAWLVKNSWGSAENTFPNRGNGNWGLWQGQDKGVYNEETEEWEYNKTEGAVQTGYFWLSYEDKSLGVVESLEFDSEDPDRYSIAQYDFMPYKAIYSVWNTSGMMMANVFCAGDFSDSDSSYITHVASFTNAPGTRVSYEVYRLHDNFTDPLDGDLIASIDETTYDHGGFHKEELDVPVLVGKDEHFSVVVTSVTSDGKYACPFPVGLTPEYYEDQGLECDRYQNAVVNERESLITNMSGVWDDLADIRGTLIRPNSDYYTIDNFPIKAFLVPGETPPPEVEITPPTAKTGLVYDKTEQALINAGSVTDETPAPKAVMYYGFEDETGDISYSTNIPEGVDAGAYKIYYKVVKGDHILDTGEVDMTIASRVLGITWDSSSSPWMYDGSSHGPAVTLTNKIEGDNVSCIIEGDRQINAGDYTASITGLRGSAKDNYALPNEGRTCSYRITKRQLTFTSDDANEEYSGDPVTKNRVVVTGDGFVGSEGVNFTVTGTRTVPGTSPNTFTYTYKDGTSAGNYNITEVTGTINVRWWSDDKVVPEHTVNVIARDDTLEYNGSVQYISGFVAGADSIPLGDETYTISGLSAQGSGTNVGTYSNSVTGAAVVTDPAGNIVTSHFNVVPVSGTLRIVPGDMTRATITLDGDLVYNGSEQTQRFSVSIGGRTLVRDTDYTVSGDKATEEGEHTLTVTGIGNYAGSRSKKYTIESPTLSGISVSQIDTLTYSGYLQTPAVKTTADQDGVTFKYSKSEGGIYTTEVPGFKDVADYKVYYRAEKDGYDTKSGDFTVTVKKAKLGISWGNTSFPYDGKDHAPTATATNAKGSDDIKFVITGAASSAGTHTAKVAGLIGSGVENYELPDDMTRSYEIIKPSSSGQGSGGSSSGGSSSGGSTSGGNSKNTTTKTTTNTNTSKTSTNNNTTKTTTNSSTKNNATNNSKADTDTAKSDDKAGTGQEADKEKDKKTEKSRDKMLKEITEGSKLSDNEEALKAILGPEKFEEQKAGGNLPQVRMKAEGLDPVPDSDRKITQKAIDETKDSIPNLKVGEYLDLTLELKEDGEWKAVSNTQAPVRFSVGAPSELVEEAACFYVLKIHNDTSSLLNDLDDDPDTVTVETDEFSTYVLLYQAKETTKESGSSSGESKEASADVSAYEPTTAPDTGSAAANTVSETGSSSDNEMWRVWVLIGLAVVIVGGLVAVCIILPRRNAGNK